MFKRKTKPAHVRLQTHTQTHTRAHWLSRTHPVREKGEAEGKNTKDWKHTHSLLSNDTRLEGNLDKTRQSGENWSVWWFDIWAERLENKESTNKHNDLYPHVFLFVIEGINWDTFTHWWPSWGSVCATPQHLMIHCLSPHLRWYVWWYSIFFSCKQIAQKNSNQQWLNPITHFPKTIKNTPLIHTVRMYFYHIEHGHCSWYESSPHIPSSCQTYLVEQQNAVISKID